MTTIGENRERYAAVVEPRPSRFADPEAYSAWAKRADMWAATQEFGTDSLVFRAWDQIHPDYKTTKDGARYVLAFGTRGTVLAPWFGPAATVAGVAR
jgi:hypothetical protein